MKRTCAGCLLALQMLAAIACAGPEPRIRVVASFFPLYVATVNVAAGIPGVEVANLAAKASGCLHDYHLTPENMAALSRADFWIVNGAGLESFLDSAVRRAPQLKTIAASDGIPLLKSDGEDNPHVWVSPSRHIKQVRTIAEGLAKADPARADAYRANGAAYAAKLERLRAEMANALEPFRGREIVTFHEAFPYFAEEFGLRVAAVIEREPGSEPSAREMADIIKRVNGGGVRVIFVEPQYSPKAAEAIARETGARIRVLDPVVSGPDKPEAYLDAMKRNLAELTDALKTP